MTKEVEKLDLEVELQMGSYHSHTRRSVTWALRVTDRASRTMVLDLRLSHEELGRLLGAQPVTTQAEVWRSQRHGKLLETATLRLPLTREDWKDDSIDDHIRFLTYRRGYKASDGWIPSVDKAFNYHRYDVDKGYSVHLTRWVDPPSDWSIQDEKEDT